MTHVRLGRLEEAIACFQAAIKLTPELVEARYNLGTQFFKLSRYDQAIRALSETVRIAPDHAPHGTIWESLWHALTGTVRRSIHSRPPCALDRRCRKRGCRWRSLRLRSIQPMP